MSAANDDDDDEKNEPASGSFFNAVPPPKETPSDDTNDAMEGIMTPQSESLGLGDDIEMFQNIIQKTKLSRTSNGFSKTTSTTDHAAPSIIQTTKGDNFVGIGKPLNDIQNPEYDENGYTLYADEVTGEKKRVFEALVEYPSVFKMKIVGRDDPVGTFAPEIVDVVAESCGVESSMVKFTERKNGKWNSVTVHAPVKSADMLYMLYENVDKDPRVKFKF